MSARWNRRWYSQKTTRDVASYFLQGAAAGFGLGAALRNAAFDKGLFSSVEAQGARVVSVGNLHVGGMGKTPAVVFLTQWALSCGKKVAVASRGYGRASTREVDFDASDLPTADIVGDEPRLIAHRCPQARVFVGRSKAQSAVTAAKAGFDFIVLDDGFQHRRLRRDVDIVVLDEAVGWGNGQVLPWGPLREPRASLSRASLVWRRVADKPRNLGYLPCPSIRAAHEAVAAVTPSGQVVPLSELAGKRAVLLTGIARPETVTTLAEGLGVEVVSHIAYSDHHRFHSGQVQAAELSARTQGALLLTTEKDAERLPPLTPAWKIRLGVRIVEGLAMLSQVVGLDARLVPANRV